MDTLMVISSPMPSVPMLHLPPNPINIHSKPVLLPLITLRFMIGYISGLERRDANLYIRMRLVPALLTGF
jgi:hypothetical protein